MRILSIDPGETSAFVIGQIRPALGSVHSLCVTSWGAWSGLEELALLAENKLFKGLDAIVIENYRIYPHKAQQHIGSQVYTAKVIGRIEWFAFKSATFIHYQMASQAKGRWPNSRMKQYPVVKRFLAHPGLKGQKEARKHILDAYRHLLTHLEVTEKLDFDDVVEWTYNV